MKILGFSRCVISGCAATLLAACGGSQPLIAPGTSPESQAIARTAAVADHVSPARSYKVLHSFGFTGVDGYFPQASMLYANGMLYGTTAAGGGGYCGFGGGYCGTVFTVTLNGVEKVLYSFANASDGWQVQAGLVRVNGKFYGATVYSQAYCGTNHGYPAYCNGSIFSVSKAGKEKNLHNFGTKAGDAASPWASLVYAGGLLYGTTAGGGSSGGGTAFSVTTSGKINVLHSFCIGADGCGPVAGLIDVNGTLYGTTPRGGRYGVAHNGNDGTVFSITPTGKVRTLHNFGKGYDGYSPKASLIELNGVLYGTTAYGGAYGTGTVFSITTGGKYKILYSFGRPGPPCCDGQTPWAGLINLNGTLYGTTAGGGSLGVGTVFSLTTSGVEKVVHNFGKFGDGNGPYSALVSVNGTLYGTTEDGGANNVGTVFSLTP